MDAALALGDNERYKVVWTVLNALRAHDDRFNATVNKIELNKNRPSQILVGRPEYTFDNDGMPSLVNDDKEKYGDSKNIQEQLALQFEQLQNVVFARMVNKVGDRRYWEQWAKSVAEIAERQVVRIQRLITEDKTHKKAFANFLGGLQKNINPSITEHEAVEMLSQHIITKPVFEALFDGYSFVKNNPISVSMQSMLDLLEDQSFDKDAETLQKFYESVKIRASGIDNAEGKQRIIIELYDKFFKTAFPKMVEKLGIVYTPVEVVDFIVHSVNDVLKKEFNRSISDENIHILDPFTGTGTFVTRLIQSGLINKKDLQRKYQNEIHANEIVLLAYYIAAVNIENAYHDVMGEIDYQAFDGICLTDTFQLGESDESEKMFSEMFPQNSARVAKQKKAPLRVIIGNPPYSVGQKDYHDMAQNQVYPKLDARIEATYAAETTAMKRALYDAYIKAFRWSSDRLDKNGGIICFVSNGSWVDGNAADGFRKCLEREFSTIYVFNLRGNQRTSGELSRKEGGKIFGSGSRTPISVTLLVKNPAIKTEKAIINYHDIGDYLSREEKLSVVSRFKTISNEQMSWKILKPNEQGDWISQRSNSFDSYIELGNKKEKGATFFNIYTSGVITNRNNWAYSFSDQKLVGNVQSMIEFYNNQVHNFQNEINSGRKIEVEKFVSTDETKIKWDQGLMDDASKFRRIAFERDSLRNGLFRPFVKQRLYFDKSFNWSRYQLPSIFPKTESKNLLICVSGAGTSKDFSVVLTDLIPDRDLKVHAQCYPLYFYEERKKQNPGMFDEEGDSEYIRRDGVSDFILERAKKQYGKNVTKEDMFYYVYGFLHSPEYRERFANDLKKMLPRLPLVEDVKDFWTFSKAGRKLADLHINYESVPPYDGVKVTGAESKFFTVEKMRFPKKDQKETINYNSKIIIDNIPAEAYEYVINGKSAIEWIMERYAVTTHKESGIKNDPNDWATEVGNPRYILDLLLSIINVSVQTVEIVKGLPKLTF